MTQLVGHDRVLVIGSKALALRLVEALASPPVGVITIDDRSDSRSRFDDLHRWSADAGVDIRVARGRSDVVGLVKAMEPDLAVVAGWYWLVAEEVLKSVPLGVLGIHFSLLPAYRGGSPLVWALINGEPVVGASIFQMTPGLDDGPIWAQCTVDIEQGDDIASIGARLETLSIAAIVETLPGVLARSAQPTQQDHSAATYCLPRLPADGLIDWGQSAKQIVRLTRAQTRPYPGAYGIRNGDRVTIWRAHEFDRVIDGQPGQVSRFGELIVVAAGDRSGVVVDEASLVLRPGDRLRGS